MKRTACAVMSLVVLFSTAVISQMAYSVNANPDWEPWKYQSIEPTLDIASPAKGGDYPSNNVWLNLTVTKPFGVNKTDYRFTSVSYCVDDWVDGVEDEKETRIEVEDHSSVVNSPSSFNFYANLTGLEDGKHTIHISVRWLHDNIGFSTSLNEQMTFYVYTPTSVPTSPIPTPTATPEPTAPPYEVDVKNASLYLASGGMFAFTLIISFLGLLVYLIKRK